MTLHCRSATKTGKRCSRKTLHGGYCYQHLPKDDFLQHGIPVIKKININNVEIEESSNCNYRNKYGEYKCENPKFETSHLCKCHFDEIEKFKDTLCKLYKIYRYKTWKCLHTISFHSKITQILYISNFMYKHREKIINYHTDENNNYTLVQECILALERVRSWIVYEFGKLYYCKRQLKKKNLTCSEYINNFKDAILKTKKCFPRIQINDNKNIRLANQIKIQKLSEIYVKVNKSCFPVICEGIDEKILSYII